jgi:hypothetical protein
MQREPLNTPPLVRRAAPFGRNGDAAEWNKYCGFLDMSVEEFMEVQRLCLREQLALLSGTPIAAALLPEGLEGELDEFRARVPLTTFEDYTELLDRDNPDLLGEQQLIWTQTTGAQASFKWVPYTTSSLERVLDNLMAAFLLASTNRRGEVRIRPGDRILFNTPERPYVSGLATFGMRDRFGFTGVLSPEQSEHMEFKERIRAGFREALNQRVDVLVSMTSVLAKMGDGFAHHSRASSFSLRGIRPRGLWRLAFARLKSLLLRRPVLPKDLWPMRAIIGWGVDSGIFREEIRRYWGRDPFEIYACTEGGLMAMQTWNRGGMVFSPYADLYEFIPSAEAARARSEPGYVPATVFLDGVVPGEVYELVLTNFNGMPLLRYRVGHEVDFIPATQMEEGIALPQFRFLGRADDRLDIAGFTRIDEQTVWRALEQAKVTGQEWVIAKEVVSGESAPSIHLYLEQPGADSEDIRARVHAALRDVDPFYRDLGDMLSIDPLRVSLLAQGTFDRFYDQRRRDGYGLDRRSPRKLNPEPEDIADLVALGRPADR